MWKSPKMIAYALLTAGLYFTLLYPFQGLTFFGGYADFGRVVVGIPIAFSFLFGRFLYPGTRAPLFFFELLFERTLRGIAPKPFQVPI